jgi:acetoacetate decarboxylase
MNRSAFLSSSELPPTQMRNAGRPPQRTAPAAELAAHPDDLVARALSILSQGNNSKVQNRGPNAVQNQSAHPPNIVRQSRTQSADLKLQRRMLSDGTECPLPIRYFDVQCLVATFLTDLDRATGLLKGTGLQPVSQADGKGIVLLYCIEYRITDIGPYNEVGLTIVATAPGDPIPANYVLDLPVTTEVARRIGREIWGYNKFLAAIDVRSNDKRFSTILRETDREIIGTFEGERGVSIATAPADILTFTMFKGKLLKTVIRVLTLSHVSSGQSFVFKIGTSRHPMTDHLRALALDGARPAFVEYADPFQALLFPGGILV